MAGRGRDDPRSTVAAIASALPGAELTHPFGDDVDVWKVGVSAVLGRAGKMFAIVSPERRIVTLKVDPDRGVELVRDHEFVTPGYHTNKRHWVSVALDDVTIPGLVEELVEDAYVVARRRAVRRRPGPLPAARPPPSGPRSLTDHHRLVLRASRGRRRQDVGPGP